MNRSNEELADVLKVIKETIDNAYDVTERKYGIEHANAAMFAFLNHGVVQYFTQDENARSNMEEFTYRSNEYYQVLADYAISSYMLNSMECDISYATLVEYVRDTNGVLDYSGRVSVKVLALAAAVSNYWATNLLSINRKLKTELVTNFIQERYVSGKREELDKVKNVTLIKFTDQEKPIFMSKSRLNNDVRNMNSDEQMPEYIPPTRREFSSKK